MSEEASACRPALLLPAGAKSDIGGIGCLLEEAPEDLPRRNVEAVTPVAVPVDIHQPDEPALPAAGQRKCASKPTAVEPVVVLIASDLPPALSVRRRFDELQFQMRPARITAKHAHCVVSWHNPSLLETVAYPIVPGVWDIFFLQAIS
jgi:hypothetical protein